MTSRPSIDGLKEISKLVSQKLCDMRGMDQNNPDRPHLIFPEKRDNSIRISEQESKVIFTNFFEEFGWFYSVETPTVQTYGSSERSARTDISLYESPDVSSKVLNIELKAGSPSEKEIRKDLEKIVREGLDGLWFNTLDNSNSGTLPNIYGKIRDAFKKLSDDGLVVKEINILFAFCILRERELICREKCVDSSTLKNIEDIFKEGTFKEDTFTV